MATVSLDVYHTEIYNFLKTVSIKFDPYKDVVHMSLLNNEHIDHDTLDLDNNNYYYQRLAGEYIPGDTPMYVTSIDTGETILFSKENLRLHPKTAVIYKVQNPEYELLCKKYPTQIDLIKSIAYPIPSTDLLYTSDKLAYIYGYTPLLQSNEVSAIIADIKNFLTVCYERWWVKEYIFEEGYPIAFMGLIWQLLPLICFTSRMTNIKTSSAHNFHIWEYLCSKGLEDYRDILTIKQSLFLYRNMEYILTNKGTSSNLFILADNILDDFSIAMYSKMIYQQQQDKYDTCQRTPEIISRRILSATKDEIPDTTSFETIENINGRMYMKGIERNNTLSYILQLEKAYGEVEEDRLPTKLLELRKETVSSSYEALLIQFIHDTLVYQWSHGTLTYFFTFIEPVYNYVVPLGVGEGLALLYYLGEKSLNTEPVYLPTTSYLRIPYKTSRPSLDELPTHIYIEDQRYTISNFVDIDTFLYEIPYSSSIIDTPSAFVDLIYNQFSIMVKHIKEVRGSADLCYTRSMWTLLHKVIDCRVQEISLSKYTTYEEFFASRPVLQAIRDNYSEMDSKEMYNKLFSVVFSAMVPINDRRFLPFVGYLDSMSGLVEKLMSLCIQLFSHNVTFLGTDRDKQSYVYLIPLAYHHLKASGTSKDRFADEYLLRVKSRDIAIAKDTIESILDTTSNQKDTTCTYDTIPAYTSNMSIQEYGVSTDNTRICTSVRYTFS